MPISVPEGLQPVKAVRVDAKMTQVELAEAIDVDSTTLSKIELGIVVATWEQRQALMRALHVRKESLFSAEMNAEIDRRYKTR